MKWKTQMQKTYHDDGIGAEVYPSALLGTLSSILG